MVLLIIGLTLFFIAHLSGLAPKIKARLRERMGAVAFRGAYAIVSGVGFALIIFGYRAATTEVVYTPPSWAPMLAHATMPIAFILLAGANMPSNFRRDFRHPMALGVLLWALTHLVANGTVQDVALFGSFAVYALIDMFLIQSKKLPQPPLPRRKDLVVVAAGLVAYLAVFLIHNHLVYIGGPTFA